MASAACHSFLCIAASMGFGVLIIHSLARQLIKSGFWGCGGMHRMLLCMPCNLLLCCAASAGGKKLETIIGAVPKSTMEQAITKYL